MGIEPKGPPIWQLTHPHRLEETRQTLRTLFERLGLLVLAGAFAAVLDYYGGLALQVSILLGLAFAVIAIWVYLLKRIATFKPFRLIIEINYDALWADLKLASTDGPKFETFTFTAISAAIYARSDERAYSTALDIFKQVPCGKGTWTPGIGEIRNGPTFFFRPVRGGYQFGVHVQSEWWKLHSRQLAPSLRDLPLTYGNDVVLGLLPYGYIPDHVRRWNQPISYLYRFDSKQRQWKKKLQEHGWMSSDDCPTHIAHRYLGIGYSDI